MRAESSLHHLPGARHCAGGVPAWAAGLVIGGAVSNLADRLLVGSVRDFLATPWIVLNVADLAVAVGIVGWLVAGSRRTASTAHTLTRPPSVTA